MYGNTEINCEIGNRCKKQYFLLHILQHSQRQTKLNIFYRSVDLRVTVDFLGDGPHQ